MSKPKPKLHTTGVIASLLVLLLTGLLVTARLAEGVPARVWMTTLVYYDHAAPAPWPEGNCFQLAPRSSWFLSSRLFQSAPLHQFTMRAQSWHVVNMHAENFAEIVRQKALPTVEVERLGGDYCMIVDPRIPRAWLRSEPCPHCVSATLRHRLLTEDADKFRAPD